MKRRRSNPNYWQVWAGDMHKYIDAIAEDADDLMTRARYGLNPGYPASSLGGGGRGGIGDPVGNLAVSDKESDPVRQAWQRAEQQLEVAVNALRLAANEIAANKAIDPDTLPTGRESTAPICANQHCDEVALWSDRTTPKAGRCQRCYQHRYRHGEDWKPERCRSGSCNHVTKPSRVA